LAVQAAHVAQQWRRRREAVQAAHVAQRSKRILPVLSVWQLAPLLLVLLLSSCASTDLNRQRPSEELAPAAPPKVLLPVLPPASPQTQSPSGPEALALKALHRGDLEIAANQFEAAAAQATDPSSRARLVFNAALCVQELQQPARVRALLQGGPEGLPLEALPRFHLLLGDSLAALGDWQGAGGEFSLGLEEARTWDPGPAIRAALLLGDARVKFAGGRLHEATGALEQATTLVLDNTPLRQQRANELLARIFYHHGLVFQRLSLSVKLRLPVERMSRDLALKRNLFKKAEELYMLGVQVRHETWSIRCGHALGVMAEDFAKDLQASELPTDLDEGSRRLYFQELAPYITAVQQEALGYYEKTDRLANRLGFKGPWVDRNREALAALKQKLPAKAQ
jgi:hypothetical protein